MPRPFIKGQEEWLKTQGYSYEMIDRAAQRLQYYKADGTPLRGLLPADPYRLDLYRKRGWTLVPPPSTPDTVVVGFLDVPSAEGTPPLYISDKPPKPKRNRKRRAKKE